MPTQVVATAGHVDHGKSTLVRALTGRDPDRLAEERRRGLTICLGYAWTTLPSGLRLALVDVPGHERFVPTMLAGAGPVPAVLFVVAADSGWQRQSAEHLAALHALDVRHGLLAVTRADLADPAEAAEQSLDRLAGSSLGRLPWVAVSGRTGAGLDELRVALDELCMTVPQADPAGDVRLWVDRVFTVRGTGTVVTGTLPAGTVRVGDELELVPGRRRVRVRGIETMEQPIDAISGTARVALNLRGVDRWQVPTGSALVSPGAYVDSETFDVRLHDLDGAPAAELMLHLGSSCQPVHVRPLGTQHARITVSTVVPLHLGDQMLLRDPGAHEVVAGASVLDVEPAPLHRRGAAAALADDLAGRALPVDAAAEIDRRGVVRQGTLRALGLGRGDGALRDWRTSASWRAAHRTAVPAALSTYARDHPLEPGMPADALAQALQLPDTALLTSVLPVGTPVADGRVGRGQLTGPVADAVGRLMVDLRESPWAAPDAARLAEVGLGRRELAAAVRAGALLELATAVCLLPGADDQAVDRLCGLPQPFTVSEARRALSTSRRVALPLLDLLDRQGRTQRHPDDSRSVTFDAVLLAGGQGRRLGGADKPSVRVGARRLVDVAVAAVSGATSVVLVGPDPGGLTDVVVLQEDPPGGGPVAGLAAALPATSAPLLAVLACDLPYVRTSTLDGLRSALGGHDVGVLVDDEGRDQPLIALWRRPALVTALTTAAPEGRSVRSLLVGRSVARASDDDDRPAWYDCDTPDELDEARRRQ